ncbi:hypothetical protein B0H19DRAFT_175687 [Mycena capillaripes]|nr:hypothetical protein B0H19DRAFT_175687 [Mycena capillaripes]
MAPPTSPPPTISAITEPDPSSDEDLVPNVPYSLQRKRKNPNTPTSQPTSKRRKAIENPTISAQRTSNAVAGPSRHSPSFRSAAGSDGKSNRPPQTSSGSKVKTSRHSMSQPVTKPVAKPLEPPSAARTKVVRRTRGEKQRQRSSFSSDDMPLVPKKKMPPNSEFPSASAPPARNGAFGREKIRDRFQSDKASNASRGVKSAPVRQKGKVAADDIIELSSSDEQPKPVFDPNEIVVILDTDSETEIKKKSKARKRNGIKKAPPDEVVEILDSDDEPARPVAKADISEKKEDANAALSTNQPNGLSALPCFPDPAENEMDLGADIDVGVEDLSLPDGEPGHGLGLSEMSVDSYSGRQPPNVSPDSSGHDHRSLAPQQIAETSAASPRAVNASSLAIERSQVPDDRPAGLQEGRMNERLPFAVPVASLPASLQDQSGILDGVARFAEQGGVLANDWPPASPDFSTAKSRALHSSHRKSPSAPHLRPNGRLEIDPSDFPDVSQNRATPQVQGPSQALSSGAFPVPGAAPSEPPSPTRRALPRRSLPSEVKDASSQSSPYKNMLDRALGTSAATLQQQLGLSLPKLDLRSLPRPSLSPTKKRPPPRTTSPSSSIDPDPTPATKPEGLPVGKKTQIATNLWDQKRMVEDIITTGKHTAQSTSTPSLHPLHRDPLLPAVPPVEEQTSLAPPRPQVKLEEAPLGRNTSLVNNFIDLSISDEEADAPQVQVQATQSSEQATTPSTNQLPQDLRQQRIERARKRMDKLKSYIGASQSTGATAVPSSNSQIPDTNTAPVVARSSGMDVDSSTGDRALSQDRMNEATDDLPAPVLPPPNDTAADMDIDNGSGTPPPLEQPFVSAVVESDLTGSSEREPPADRASPQQPEEAVNSTEPDIAHQRPAAGYERRSYDDQEVYDLEYIGPPAPTVPTISDPDEDAVEDLVAPTSESDDPSGHGDTVGCHFRSPSNVADVVSRMRLMMTLRPRLLRRREISWKLLTTKILCRPRFHSVVHLVYRQLLRAIPWISFVTTRMMIISTHRYLPMTVACPSTLPCSPAMVTKPTHLLSQ